MNDYIPNPRNRYLVQNHRKTHAYIAMEKELKNQELKPKEIQTQYDKIPENYCTLLENIFTTDFKNCSKV